MNKLAFFLLLFTGLFFLSCQSTPEGGQPAVRETPFAHFQDTDIIELTIKSDWKNYLMNSAEPAYQPAVLTLKNSSSDSENFNVKIKPRGAYRKELCDFPPLKVKFSKEEMEALELHDFSTLKLVPHCRLDSSYNQLVLKEYLAFQLYNVLTDSSFRTQLAHISYKDSGGKLPEFKRFGFLIENADELSARLNGRILREETGLPKHIQKSQFKLFTLFQFMIGNTDWALKNHHNVKFIQTVEGDLKTCFPVPYDFDFSGLVDAPYAEPHFSIPVEEVTERHFQWKGRGEEDFSVEVQLFLQKKKELLDVVNGCEYLDEKTRAEGLSYLNSFFEIMESEGANLKSKFSAAE